MKKVLLLLILLLYLLLAACRRADPVPMGTLSPNTAVIAIAEDGVYRLTLTALQAAGLNLDALEATNLHLSSAGTAVPYLLQGEQLIFYGQAPDNRYTATRPYLLTVGKAGAQMAQTAVSAAPATLLNDLPQTMRLEENNVYLAQARRADDSDLWFWQEIGLQQKVSLTFNLPSLSSNSAATMRLHLWGISYNAAIENDHDFDLILNGQYVTTVSWDGQTYYTAEVPLPPGLLKTGNNSLVLDNTPEGAAMVDIMALNWIELVYMAPATAVNDRLTFHNASGSATLGGFSGAPVLLDISDPAAPQQLTGWECGNRQACLSVAPEMRITAVGPAGLRAPKEIRPLRASDWADPANQADLIIITTDALATGLDELVAARQAQGLGVAAVPVSEIYDEFGYGAATPESIRAFLQHAHAQWQAPKPRYVLLVGDATSDYRNYLGRAPQNIISPFMVPVEFSGETVSDSRLVDLNGDQKPDLAIGRWPVDSLADVRSLVARTLAYEQGTAPLQALFATDSSEAQFAQMAERLATENSMNNMILLNGATAPEVTATWNEGAWLTTYIGHGSIRRWGKENIFNLEAVSGLQTSAPSIVLQLTCLSGLFAHPEETSLTEAMMRHPTGPVLHVAATSLTFSSDQEQFAAHFVRHLQDPGYTRIGDAFQAAKQALNVANPGLLEVSDTFSLFGDPSALIVRPMAGNEG